MTQVLEVARLCFHCGQPVPAGIGLQVIIGERAQPMCCRGCQAVAEAIVAGGLTDYYRFRTEPSPTAREAVPDFLRQTAIYDNPAVQKSFVHAEAGNVREASLILEGIVCAACVWLNEQHLARLHGVLGVSVNYTTHRARIRWDAGAVTLSRILAAVSEIGYLAHPYDPNRAQEVFERERRTYLRRLVVAGALGMQVMILAVSLYAGDFSGIEIEFTRLFHWLSLGLTLPILGYAAVPFYRNALRDLRRRHAGMDVPVTLGLTIAFLGSAWATISGVGDVYFDSIAMFVFFLLTGRYFELIGRKRAAEVSEAITHMLPAVATRLDGDVESVVAVSELCPGDRVQIRPGEIVPADGHIESGRSSVDESLLTGESLPRARTVGDTLIGGSINVESPLVLRIDKTGNDTAMSAILRLLDRAQTEKPAVAQAADRAAAWFVARVLLLAFGVALFWMFYDPSRWLPITLAVLVVTCPCALSLATPTAMVAATGRLMRLGLVATRGHALETLARANLFVFDKTGTLTHGRLRLLETHMYANVDAAHALDLAAALEKSSEHPVAHALRAASGPSSLQATGIVNVPGAGLSGAIDGTQYFLGTAGFLRENGIALADDLHARLQASDRTLVLLGTKQTLLSLFVIGDEIRPGAHELVATLQRQGKRVILLTGDHAGAAKRVAEATGITDFESGLRPQEKLERVRALATAGAVVAMIGDGVNDAAALAAAHVSIAMGGGTQLAAASADMILLSERLPHLADGVQIAKRALTIIRQNLGWAFAYNLVALPFAAAGFVAPWMAAIGMSASSLVVTANALRLTAGEGRGTLRSLPRAR